MLDSILASGLAGGLIIFIILGSVQLFFFVKKLTKDSGSRKNLLTWFVQMRYLIILILIFVICSLLYWYNLRITSNEEISLNLLEMQRLELEIAKLENENLEEDDKDKIFCEDISLDRTAPGYTGEDLDTYVNELNSKGLTKNISNGELKYLIDSYFASQWITTRPECKYYIEKTIEERRSVNAHIDKQEKQLQEMSGTQNKLLKYNQCLTASDQSTCQFLLY